MRGAITRPGPGAAARQSFATPMAGDGRITAQDRAGRRAGGMVSSAGG